jgi:hypothetical protein
MPDIKIAMNPNLRPEVTDLEEESAEYQIRCF